MKLNVTPKLLDRDGEVITFNKFPLTISRAICSALDAGGAETKLSADEKIKRFKLACRIHDAELPVEISVEEAALIQKAVNDFFTTPLIVAPIYLAIEAAAESTNALKNGEHKEDAHRLAS